MPLKIKKKLFLIRRKLEYQYDEMHIGICWNELSVIKAKVKPNFHLFTTRICTMRKKVFGENNQFQVELFLIKTDLFQWLLRSI